MQEKFSVSLEMTLNKFKSQVETAKSKMRELGEATKSSIKLDDAPLKEMSATQELLRKQINDLKGTLEDPITSKMFRSHEVLEMRAELERLEKQYDKTNIVAGKFNSTTNKMGGMFEKGLKSAKRFTLSLFGIHSVYRMLSRASSAYLQQDEETSNKIQAAWVGLGSIFAPLLETVANFVIKAVSYINVFIKALTGIDYLARASAKSLNKTNSSAKKLSKTLAGFDEITNLDSESNSGGIGSNWSSFFDDVELNPEVVKKLKELADWLKKNEDLVKAVGIALGITFGAKAIGGILTGIGGLLGSKTLGTGLIGLSGILGGLATIGGIAISVYFVGKILQEAKELRDELEKIRIAGQEGYRNWVKETKDIDTIYNSMNTHRATTEQALKNTNEWIYKVTGNSQTWLDIAGTIATTSQDNLDRIKDLYDVEIKTTQQKQRTREELSKQLDVLYEVREAYKEQGRDTKKIDETISNYSETISNISQELKGKSKDAWSTILGTVEQTFEKLLGIDKIKLGNKKLNVDLITNSVDTSPIKKAINKLFDNPLGKLLGVPKLDVGTNYIPQDTLAMVHKGEAVVPKKFNSATYFSGNSEQTNNLLAQLIERVENIEINPYTTVKDVGTASVSYINNQGRIMGRGVI